jgi:hypothetical protein
MVKIHESVITPQVTTKLFASQDLPRLRNQEDQDLGRLTLELHP